MWIPKPSASLASRTQKEEIEQTPQRPANLLGFCCFPGVKPTEKEIDLVGVLLTGVVAAVLPLLLPPSSSETQQLLRMVAMLSAAVSPENPPRPQASRSAFGGEDRDRGLVPVTIGEGMAAPLLMRLMVAPVCLTGAGFRCVCVRWLSLAPAKSRLDFLWGGGRS